MVSGVAGAAQAAPRFRTSVRWWIAGRSVHALILMALSALAVLAAGIAVAWTLTEASKRSVGSGCGTGKGC